MALEIVQEHKPVQLVLGLIAAQKMMIAEFVLYVMLLGIVVFMTMHRMWIVMILYSVMARKNVLVCLSAQVHQM